MLPSNEANRGSLCRRTAAVTDLLMFGYFAKFELVSGQKRWTSFLHRNEKEWSGEKAKKETGLYLHFLDRTDFSDNFYSILDNRIPLDQIL